ncbi:MAG: hypothetical protein J0G32_01685, partial [Alphaproteobacteria bacterium]|nr:hypothetical protein [Alphaproteobacteria bacterium]
MTLSVLPIVSPVQAQVAQNTATEGQVIQTAEAGDSGFGQVLEVAMQSGDVSAAQNQSNLFTMTLETLQTQEIIPSLPEDVDSTAVYTDEMGLNAAQIQNASQPIIQPSDINAEIDNTQLIDSYSETIELPEITPQKSYADDSFGSESKSLPDNLDNVNNGYDISQENIPIDFNNQAVNANAAANIQPSLQTEVQALDDVLPSEFDEVSMESLSLKRPKAINQVKEVKLESITSAEEIADLEANLEYNNDIDNANLETPRYNEAELVDAEPEVILNSKSSLEVGLDLNKTVSSNSAASADEIVKEIKAGEALASENISANQVSAEIKPASNSSGNQDSSFAEKKDNETGISDNNNSGHITNGSNKTEFAQKL